MRHILTTLTAVVVMFLSSSSGQAHAQTNTPSPAGRSVTPVVTGLDDLKERLATRVAALRDTVKRAVHGTVSAVSVASATVETKTKSVKIELTDEVKVTQVINGKRTVLSTDDVEKDDVLTVFGSYDTTLDLLKAQFIFIQPANKTERFHGFITDIDADAFTLTVETSDDRTVIVDIEKSTKTLHWTLSDGIAKSGFSKINTGDAVHIVARPDPKRADRYSAVRILDVGNVRIAQAAPTPTPTEEPTDTPAPTRRPAVRASPTIEVPPPAN